MHTVSDQMATAAETNVAALARFLYREAQLLDEKRWQEWLALYTEDCFYWVPSVAGQKDPVHTVSLYAEDRMRMEMRIIRITHPRAFSQDRPTRMSHVVANVAVDPDGGAGWDGGVGPRADIVVRSVAHVAEFRKDNQRLLAGTARHWLRRDGDGWKIAMKRLDLINCDAPMEAVQLFL